MAKDLKSHLAPTEKSSLMTSNVCSEDKERGCSLCHILAIHAIEVWFVFIELVTKGPMLLVLPLNLGLALFHTVLK
jgi:hypothetical protein